MNHAWVRRKTTRFCPEESNKKVLGDFTVEFTDYAALSLLYH